MYFSRGCELPTSRKLGKDCGIGPIVLDLCIPVIVLTFEVERAEGRSPFDINVIADTGDGQCVSRQDLHTFRDLGIGTVVLNALGINDIVGKPPTPGFGLDFATQPSQQQLVGVALVLHA